MHDLALALTTTFTQTVSSSMVTKVTPLAVARCSRQVTMRAPAWLIFGAGDLSNARG